MASARPTRYHAQGGKKQKEPQRGRDRRPPPQGRTLRDPRHPRPAVRVRRSADTRTKPVITPTKIGEERTLGIGPRTVEVLKKHRSRQLEERITPTSWDDPGWVFPNTRGKVRLRDSVMRSLRELLREAGLPSEVRFHDLRHTAGTHALRRGRPNKGGLQDARALRSGDDPTKIRPRVGRNEGRDRSRDGRTLLGSDPNQPQHGPISSDTARRSPGLRSAEIQASSDTILSLDTPWPP